MARTRSKRVGRPRAATRAGGDDVAEDILAAAAALVARQGFTATSTRTIAAEAGLRQPSIFHYFASKEALFREMLDRAIEPVLAFIDAEADRTRSPAEALARLVVFDTHHLVTNPFCGVAFAAAREEVRRHHPEIVGKRNRLIDHYGDLIAAGVADGIFAVDEARTTTLAVFGLGESTVWWAAGSDHEVAEDIARRHAVLALRMLLRRPASAERIVRAALPLDG